MARVDLGAEYGGFLKHRCISGLALHAHVDRLEPRAGLLHEARLPLTARKCDRDRGAKRRMAGERDLLPDREDPVSIVGAIRACRLHEARLGETRLAGEAKHRLVVELIRVVHDRERVALERALGEDVEHRIRVGA